jgi:hypothetical protein
MIKAGTINRLWSLIEDADVRYGDFASVHEAIGVCTEEWDELRNAMHANNMSHIKRECLDLAAALIRLHDQLQAGSKIVNRSFPLLE